MCLDYTQCMSRTLGEYLMIVHVETSQLGHLKYVTMNSK